MCNKKPKHFAVQLSSFQASIFATLITATYEFSRKGPSAPINHPELVATVVSNSQEYWSVSVNKYRELTGYSGEIVSTSVSSASEYWRNKLSERLIPAAVKAFDEAKTKFKSINSSPMVDRTAETIDGVRVYWADKAASW